MEDYKFVYTVYDTDEEEVVGVFASETAAHEYCAATLIRDWDEKNISSTYVDDYLATLDDFVYDLKPSDANKTPPSFMEYLFGSKEKDIEERFRIEQWPVISETKHE